MYPNPLLWICSGLVSAWLLCPLFIILAVLFSKAVLTPLEASISPPQVGARRLAEFFFTPGGSIGTAIATFSSQNYGAGQRKRIFKGIRTALFLYALWWLAAMALTFLFSPQFIRLITGSTNPEVISSAVLYMKINIPSMPPLMFLVILRTALQGMKHQLAPLFCSLIEMTLKIVFALLIVPLFGYFAVCICEPVTWLICAIFIIGAAVIWRADFRDTVSP